MLTPLNQLEQQISRTDQQLWYHLILEQQETNRLLQLLLENKQELPEPILKRPEIMKKMKLTNPPKGWQTWNNEKMLEHLKGVS